MHAIKEARRKVVERYVLQALALLELILSLVFFVASRVSGSAYFKGVAVGLLISGVTTAIAYAVEALGLHGG